MQRPFFSILIPCVNAKKYIDKSLNSCFNQLYDDYEIILCDNGSNDGIEEKLKTFKNNKFRYFLGKKRVTTIQLRNFLIQEAKGRYIIWLQPGDILSLNYTEAAFMILKEKNYDILEFKTVWKKDDKDLINSEIKNVVYEGDSCIDYYFSRDDQMQDSLWGKVINSEVMKKCIIQDYKGVFSIEEVFYSLPLYANATSFKTVMSSQYMYDIEIDHFHGLNSFTLNNIKYMCKIRNEQMRRNLELLKETGKKYHYQCLSKLYLFNIFNDILNLEDKKEMKEALEEFYKYFNVQLSSNYLK